MIIACPSVLKSPPTVPMITADCALVTSLVRTLKLARGGPCRYGDALGHGRRSRIVAG